MQFPILNSVTNYFILSFFSWNSFIFLIMLISKIALKFNQSFLQLYLSNAEEYIYNLELVQ